MIAWMRSLVLTLILLAAMPAAWAGDVQIQKAAVGNSVGPGGEPQLDLHVLGTASSPDPGSLIGYFSDAKTGEPLTAPSDSPFSTTSGQVAVSSSSIKGGGHNTLFYKKMSIPHFALNVEPLKKRRIKVSLFLDPGSSPPKDVDFVDDIGFDFILDNPFKHGKKHDRPRVDEIFRPRFRQLLPDRPAIRMDRLGRWNAFKAFDPRLPDPIRRQVATTVLIENGRNVILGGNAAWRHEGSANSWQGLYDYIMPARALVLPRISTTLASGRQDPVPGQIMIEPRLLEIDGTPVFPASFPETTNGASRSEPQILIDSRILEVDDRFIKFDFGANQIDAYREVPALSDIPSLGRLFRNGEDVRVNRTLLLFITPRIIQQDER